MEGRGGTVPGESELSPLAGLGEIVRSTQGRRAFSALTLGSMLWPLRGLPFLAEVLVRLAVTRWLYPGPDGDDDRPMLESYLVLTRSIYMPMTRLSTKGQLILPKEVRERHGWTPGTELAIEDQGDFVIVRRIEDLPEVSLEDLAGCAGYEGPALSLDAMEAAIARGARESR